MPTCLIEDNDRVGAEVDCQGDLGEMQAHRVSISLGHHKAGFLGQIAPKL